MELSAVPRPYRNGGPSDKITLSLESLVKRYGEITAVDNLTLAIREGEVFGLLGPNGAGKTTTIHLICGLLRPDAGRVTIGGRPVEAGNGGVTKEIGVCPQDIIIWPKLTCLEQLEFMGAMYRVPRLLARRRGESLLRDMGLWDKRGKPAATLSGGMKRRLNFILALVHDPAVLVLDEPEAGLDPQSRVMLRGYIHALARRKTILFTTHNMDEAERVCDRVAIMDRGALLRVDTPDELKRTVGGGHVLEIQVGPDERRDEAVAVLRELGLEIVSLPQNLVVRGSDVVAMIPRIMECLKLRGLTAGDLRIRENSLEDVFIALTGRRLRE